MNTMAGKTVKGHLFKFPYSKADQQRKVSKCSGISLIAKV